MDEYYLLRYLHILGATLLFGTGLGTAFHGWMGYRSGDPKVVAVVARNVVLADWLFTAPAVVGQFVTGVLLAVTVGYGVTASWIVAALVLYAITGACWLPVVWLQIQMAKMAKQAAFKGTPLPARYWRYSRYWFALGWPAFISVLIIFHLMVSKPELW
jgi:uncharacterized membrane protein